MRTRHYLPREQAKKMRAIVRHFESSAPLEAPLQTVWRELADVTAWPDWVPTVTALEPLDSPSLRVGARYAIVQPRLRPATWVVTVLDPPRRFAWETRSPGLRTVADHVLREAGSDKSEIILSIDFIGLFAPFAGRAFGSTAKRYLVEEASAIGRRFAG
jgi:Polyketide cyclase / dehydrase and lipid transport